MRPITHGHTVNLKRSPTYVSWKAMRRRCYNRSYPDFHRYGGRGIKVCARWRSFSAFLEDMGERPDGTTLERIDRDGDYSPTNCKWATRKEQNRNHAINRLITIGGKTQCVAAWAEESGIGDSTIRNRLATGWPVERLLEKPRGARHE